jgi:4,5:9,10-diseco-3-hydroxy-5,9,17-trioxoandrosta-1(10),2-diene-4-oate hydrolase
MLKQDVRQALIDIMGIPIIQTRTMAGAVNTAYLSAGAGSSVICLHGGGAGAVTWYPVIGPLAQHFRVIAPDIVGYGESDKPDASYDKAYFASWLKQFLDAIGVVKTHIIGLSQGGAIALQFTLDYPEMVDKLVLVNSGGLGAKPPFMSIAGMAWLNTFPSSFANRFYSRYILFKPENRDPNHGRYSIEVLKSKGGKKAFSQGRGVAVSAFSEAALCSIKNQTLVLWGENDRLFPIEVAAKAVAVMPDAKLLRIKDAGHLSMMDQPAVFNRAVLNFLQDKMEH